ncbi:MAG: hypothetical protein KA911_04500, partial [Xanthomonadales bacterium]|nr:hypothetical protein [Xanthomonadales bacterium]MBP7417833.1 hypothetical protein [Xanthomonadales bacterium]
MTVPTSIKHLFLAGLLGLAGVAAPAHAGGNWGISFSTGGPYGGYSVGYSDGYFGAGWGGAVYGSYYGGGYYGSSYGWPAWNVGYYPTYYAPAWPVYANAWYGPR